ncbi:PREDICTED: nucleoredoxin-like protein 2 [Papilio xuthus]|uniref:Nucleoredoxin-like protein 2 n=1 Tax=Papilio xuthus TaxID=66420 RepID=A0AAJ6ZLF2_PAPXU|nr:PREDICTED: nucleoredoxin-like protein 2 [Papilio xuthus]
MSASADSESVCAPYNWVDSAAVYNKRGERVLAERLRRAPAIALLFTSRGVDREGVVARFCRIYQDISHLHLPFEVIYVPMDDTAEDAAASYGEQPDWLTLRFDDTLVHELKYMHEVTCIPQLLVVRGDGAMISSHGISDLEEYGRNAVLSWLPSAACSAARGDDAVVDRDLSLLHDHHIKFGDAEQKV